RYGDVRGTDTGALRQVADALLVRICAGLPAALTALDDEAAATLRDRVGEVHAAVALQDCESGRELWLRTLARLADRDDLHGLVTGRLVRLLLDAGRLDTAAAGVRLGRALSVGTAVPAKAAWIEGFLAGGGTLLIHDAELLALLDEWVAQLDAQTFVDVLPLLRRTFGTFAPAERRGVGERVRRTPGGPAVPGGGADFDDVDRELGEAALPTVLMLLGADR
ncbi:MAG: DUF5682 family protein, partial [Actinomycetota bacterium]|nr:DUF5682 family protein [Actinomycetota bacterium]